jgi:acid phosphatase type 7
MAPEASIEASRFSPGMKNRNELAILSSLLAMPALPGQEAPCPEVEALSITRGPYVQAVDGDRAEVHWVTGTSMQTKLRWRAAPDGPWRELPPSSGTSHRGIIDSLLPDTEYQYEVLDAAAGVDPILAGGPAFRFRTAPPPGTPFRAIALGDSGDESPAQLAVKKMLCGLDVPADFFFHTGDLDYEGDLNVSLFGPYREILAGMPFYPAHGNHDPSGDQWESLFSPPLGDPGETSTFYSFDWGSAHFTFLDTELDVAAGSAQMQFLRADLERARARDTRWVVLVFHVPLFTIGAYFLDDRKAEVNATLAPVTDEFAIDLVITGHDHNWQRSHPIRNGVPRDAWQDPEFIAPAGTLHIVTGGGGALLYPRDPRHNAALNRVFIYKHHALELEVTDDYISGRAIAPCDPQEPCNDGVVVLDSFTIRKDRLRPPLRFLRGDADLSGALDLADAVIVLNHLFSGGPPLECPAAADSDGNGFPLDLTDPVYLLQHLFLGDMPPPPPYPECGPAPTADDSGCLRAGCPA